MFVEQLSVFLENKAGRLDEVLSVISNSGINIVSISLADTADFGVLRMLCSDPFKAHALLKDTGITSKVNEVIVVSIPQAVGSLKAVVKRLNEEGLNIQYVYGLSLNDDGASIALKTDDLQKTIEILQNENVRLYNQEEISKL
ncbi:ACT domain-containing protein [Butyrivibrio sp. MC2013]|uniref:ACT domain-containing protein n=1 Tax=Butyrivibrio sp. MC2013 TaxID=1280686 RepID=UPI00041C99DA|nr:ACT domain-containing protein [Butyrivibrio sp. MC2013]